MKRSNRMLLFIFIFTLGVTLLIASNVFLVSVAKVHAVSGTSLKAYADSANMQTEYFTAMRGYIYDRNGNIIAQDNSTYNIKCILDKNRPSQRNKVAYVDDPTKTAEILSVLLNMDKDKIYDLLSQDLYQTELGTAGRNLSKEKKDEILSYGLNGIEFYPSIKRSYPLGTFASHLIGFAQSDESGRTVGRMGLEAILEEELAGINGQRTYQSDKHGYILPGMKITEVSAINGNNVNLTLDKEIQESLEQAFMQTNELFDADRVWGAVMEVDTGKVLAWGQSPTFNPNELDITDYNNYGAQLPYEPGSTMKAFVWAAAINEGVYDGTKEVYSGPFCFRADEGLNPYRVSSGGIGCITNAGYKNWGMVGYDYGLILSSNSVTAALLTEVINPEIYEDYLDRFHFFQAVDTDGLKEEIGIKHYKWPSEKITAAYGQGSTVTMLQLLQAYSAIFGDGKMHKPYFIDSIKDSYDSQKVIYQAEPTVVGEPITAESAAKLREILYGVLYDPIGTGKWYQVPEIEVCGKTGTTQVLVSGSYASGKTIASAMLAMPANDPKYIVYYAFEAAYDKNAHYKTEPIKTLLRKVAMYTNLTATSQTNGTNSEYPSESEINKTEIKSYEMPNVINHSHEYAMSKLEGLDTLNYVLGSSDTIIDQFPKAGESVSTSQRVFLLTDTDGFIMPDLTGWSKKDVTALWEITGFGLKISGSGQVISQNVPVDAFVSKDTEIEVELQ